MTAVHVDHLEKRYAEVPVLHDLSLDIPDGSFTVLLGPSGCGKSTLLNCIAGLDDVQGGAIRFDDRDVTHLEPKDRDIAMVFQSYALYPTMTVRRNMGFGLSMARRPKAEIEEKVQGAARLLQIEHLLDRRPPQLSGGQRQRVAIGRALVRNAKVFLFDEPLSNLDAKLRAEMRVEIKRLHERLGVTMIYVTHDQIEAMTLATRIAVLRGGVIEQYDEPENLYERPSTRFVADFVGSPGINFLDGTLDVSNGVASARIGDSSMPLNGYPFKAKPDHGQPIVVGIRPERIGTPGEVGHGYEIEMTHSLTEPMGADSLVWFDWQGQSVSARLRPAVAHQVQARARLAIDLSAVSIFSAESEQRM